MKTGPQLSWAWLVIYAVAGLALVLVITRSVGFRRDEEGERAGLRRTVRDFAELPLQSFLTAFAVLLLFGIVDLDDSLFLDGCRYQRPG